MEAWRAYLSKLPTQTGIPCGNVGFWNSFWERCLVGTLAVSPNCQLKLEFLVGTLASWPCLASGARGLVPQWGFRKSIGRDTAWKICMDWDARPARALAEQPQAGAPWSEFHKNSCWLNQFILNRFVSSGFSSQKPGHAVVIYQARHWILLAKCQSCLFSAATKVQASPEYREEVSQRLLALTRGYDLNSMLAKVLPALGNAFLGGEAFHCFSPFHSMALGDAELRRLHNTQESIA